MYVYKITNLINKKIYIGITKNIEERFKYHKQKYNHKKEYNKVLYRGFRKYGIENFKFTILYKNISKKEACDIEIKLIKELKTLSHENGYNVTSGGNYRITFGESNNTSVMTEKEVIKIRKRRANGEKGSDIYKEFEHKISKSGFQKIWLDKNWKYIDKYKIEDSEIVIGAGKLSAKDVKEIKKMIIHGESNKNIQQMFNITYRDLWRIKTKRTYKNIT